MEELGAFNEKFDILENIETWGDESVRNIRNNSKFSLNRIYISEIMAFWFDYNDFQARSSRILCLIFISIGYFCLFIPSANVIALVFMKIGNEFCRLINNINL